jgi:uncharacterized SAM-binding protein YcdF (DUF218 family)
LLEISIIVGYNKVNQLYDNIHKAELLEEILIGISEAKIISRVKRKSNSKKVIAIILIVAVLQFLAVEGLLVFNSGSEPLQHTKYLVILGAGLNGEVPSTALNERLKAGLAYLVKYPDTQVVVSGGRGRGESITEAEAMRKYLLSKGVSEDRILVEDHATITMENFKYSKQLIEQKTGKALHEVTFVTNSFHIFRANMVASRNGLTAYAISGRTVEVVVPLYIREYFAFIKSFLIDW